MRHRYNTRFQAIQLKSQPPTPQPSPQLAPQPSPLPEPYTPETSNALKIIQMMIDKVDPYDKISTIESSIEIFSYLIYHPGLLARAPKFRTTVIRKMVEYRTAIQSDRITFQNYKDRFQSNPDDLDPLLTLDSLLTFSKKVSLMEHMEKLMNKLDVVLDVVQIKSL